MHRSSVEALRHDVSFFSASEDSALAATETPCLAIETERVEVKRFPLSEVAAEDVPDDIKHPKRWLMERLRDGRLQGYKFGNRWYMTAAQREQIGCVNRAPQLAPEPDAVDAVTLTSVSPRRMKRSA